MAESYGEALSFLQKTATETGGTVYDQVVDVISLCAMLHLLLIYIARQFAAPGPRKLQLMTPLMHTKKHRSASLRKHKY